MNTLKVEAHPLAQDVSFSDSELIVNLVDGRVILVPISWFPSLASGTQKQRNNWELLGEGDGIHWPDLDEDLSVRGLLLGFH
ncbi:DUF2442 domain-containing protein [Sansalvadorimonas verongulae]|uniref:DUF2442 domain-containing protein n=1 Tax=Sansalvadorimonas verongulae TaxID=2172824 RepID=UPI0012BBE416|nr:DUF2442 domain-containing protein [Sansalvadorimonas verongulae]MTI13199.1 DUF2442 domain-containing protein [Sansalvadorimonas verongulae]